jgi:dolichyl-phosphate-mannose-protein mannosyltransferase
MDASPSRRPRPSYLWWELAGVVLFVALLAVIKVVVPEPPNYYRSANPQGRLEARGEVNKYYDRTNDETAYYVPVIRQIYARWPTVDLLADGRTDKPPGYPFLMATAAKVVGLNFDRLRLVQILLSAMIPAVLYFWLRMAWPAVAAIAVLAPLALSSFFVKASVYFVTDNVALLCAATALFALLRTRWTVPSLGLLLIANAVAVSIRQDTLWLAGPTLLALGILLWRRQKGLRPESAKIFAWQCLLLAGAILIPAAMILGLWLTWKGLAPPTFYLKGARAGFGLAPVAYILSVVAIGWWPYLFAVHGFSAAVKLATHRPVLWCGAVGLLAALAANTEYNQTSGHWGGYLWSLAAMLPAFGGRSLPFLLLAPLGALALGVGFRRLIAVNAVGAAILGVAFLAWAMSLTVNPYIFHRYYEPYVLLFLVAMACVSGSANRRPFSLQGYAPLLLFGGGQLAITIFTLYFSLFPTWRR